jgi:glutamate dehydrogenase/leucine dehydrogenase
VTRADEFKSAAATLVSDFRAELGVDLNYDNQSIEWLDGYINRVAPQLDNATLAGLATAIGSYLGETIIATYGGAWHYNEHDDQWGIRFDDGAIAFPFTKVYKQFDDGEFESIYSFFTVLPIIRQRSA